MKRKRHFQNKEAFLPPLLFLLLCCLCGIILGQVYANQVSESVIIEIKRYLKDYICLDGIRESSSEAFFSTLWGYFRYPIISYLLSFSSIGVLLLPIVALIFGFFLSFSVSCFTAAYGSYGVVVSFAVIGVRCMVTLPCFLIVSVHAFRKSAFMANSVFGRCRRAIAPQSGLFHLKSLCVLSLILILGVCIDIILSPQFLHLALEQIPA